MTECSHSKLFIKNPVEEEYQKWFSRLQESSDFWIDTGGRTRLKRRGAEGVEPLLLVAWPRPDHTSYSYENEMGIPFLSSSFISFSCNSWFLDVNRFRVHTQSGNREGIPLLPRFSLFCTPSLLLKFFEPLFIYGCSLSEGAKNIARDSSDFCFRTPKPRSFFLNNIPHGAVV